MNGFERHDDGDVPRLGREQEPWLHSLLGFIKDRVRKTNTSFLQTGWSIGQRFFCWMAGCLGQHFFLQTGCLEQHFFSADWMADLGQHLLQLQGPANAQHATCCAQAPLLGTLRQTGWLGMGGTQALVDWAS